MHALACSPPACSTEVEEALGLEHHERQAKRDHQPHEQHRHPEADDRAEGKPGITGVSRQRGSSGAGGSSKVDQQGRERPAGSGEGPTQWAALQEPLLQPDDAEHQGVSHEHGHGHDPMQQRSVGGGGSSGITGAVRHALSSGRETVKGIVERVEKVGSRGPGFVRGGCCVGCCDCAAILCGLAALVQ